MTDDALTTDLLHQAKQGDAQAIATLLNRQLAPRGLRIQTQRKEAVLALLIDSEPAPTTARLLPYLEQSFKKLASPQLERVRVYGRAHGQEKPAWMAEIHLTTTDVAAPDAPNALDVPNAPPPPETESAPLAAQLNPPSPPQPIACLPRQPLWRQWLLLNGIAILGVWMLAVSSTALLGETSGWRQAGVALLGAIGYSGVQSYGLARRLLNAPVWWAVSVIPIGVWFLVRNPLLQVLAVALLWGTQSWVFKPHRDRVYWPGWVIGNFLGIICVGCAIALLQSSGWYRSGPLWEGLIWLVFLGGMTLVQGLLLEALLRSLPDRPVLPPEAYFSRAIAQLSRPLSRLFCRQLSQGWRRQRQGLATLFRGLKRALKRSPKPAAQKSSQP
ncbi:MAG: hypothetical protein ACPGVO_20635 [Spirulinaceae cyanobacterium]